MKLSKKEYYEYIGLRRNVIKANKQFVKEQINLQKAKAAAIKNIIQNDEL